MCHTLVKAAWKNPDQFFVACYQEFDPEEFIDERNDCIDYYKLLKAIEAALDVQ